MNSNIPVLLKQWTTLCNHFYTYSFHVVISIPKLWTVERRKVERIVDTQYKYRVWTICVFTGYKYFASEAASQKTFGMTCWHLFRLNN